MIMDSGFWWQKMKGYTSKRRMPWSGGGWAGEEQKACVEELAQRCLNNDHAVRHERKI